MSFEPSRTHFIVGLTAAALLLAVFFFAASAMLTPAPAEEPAPSTGAAGRPAGTPTARQPTPAAEPTRAYPGTVSGTPTPNPLPSDRPDPLNNQSYTIRQGDTLSGIAYAFGCTVDEIAAANSIDPDAIWPGQQLLIPVGASQSGPECKLIPDSELVYGPAYIHFDLAGFVTSQGGYLTGYTENVEGQARSGTEIVQLVAQRYSIGPRVLLALLEHQAGWVTNPQPAAETLSFPMGSYEDFRAGLFYQLSWAAAELNSGYYGWKYDGWTTIRLLDGSRAAIAPGLNAGTVAIQSYAAQVTAGEEWIALLGPQGFAATYERLFGNPFAYRVEPLIPPGLTQPELRLPWTGGETWYLTGGPHGGWGRGSGWAALDFTPAGEVGCQVQPEWVAAAAPGLVLRSEYGEVVVDLDGDGYEQSGWVLTYLHVHSSDRVTVGTWLEQGQHIGHPSCEGGFAEATHLHFARRYNGEWLPADSPVPFVLSGWTAQEAEQEYDGWMVNGDQVREACECSVVELNGLLSDNTVDGRQ